MIDFIKKYKRRVIQLASMVLYNFNVAGLKDVSIYKGNMKSFCVPGLNCYSCPAAIASCPLGALQQAVRSKSFGGIYYVLGLLILFGILLGRTICGFLCPMGFIQELIYKIKTKKILKNHITKKLCYIKYIILVFFVIILPIVLMQPSFCKYICPTGTLEGGIFFTIFDVALRQTIGFLFSIKIIILIIIILASIFLYRFFCRFICPLGAIYSLFNKIAVVRITFDKNKCIHCNKCINICKMDIKEVGDRECIMCGDCVRECPEKIIIRGTILNHTKKD